MNSRMVIILAEGALSPRQADVYGEDLDRIQKTPAIYRKTSREWCWFLGRNNHVLSLIWC